MFTSFGEHSPTGHELYRRSENRRILAHNEILVRLFIGSMNIFESERTVNVHTQCANFSLFILTILLALWMATNSKLLNIHMVNEQCDSSISTIALFDSNICSFHTFSVLFSVHESHAREKQKLAKDKSVSKIHSVIKYYDISQNLVLPLQTEILQKDI